MAKTLHVARAGWPRRHRDPELPRERRSGPIRAYDAADAPAGGADAAGVGAMPSRARLGARNAAEPWCRRRKTYTLAPRGWAAEPDSQSGTALRWRRPSIPRPGTACQQSKIENRKSRILILLLFLVLGVRPAAAVSPAEVPNPRQQGGWVTDMAGAIPTETEASLNTLLAALEQDTTAEVAVVTVPDTGGEVPKEFATSLFNRWGIGKAGEDNGVLVLLTTGDRRVEVETGYGIEPVLPDGRVGAILDRYAVPYFRRGDYGTGLLFAVEQMGAVIRREYQASGAPAAPGARRPAEPAPAPAPPSVPALPPLSPWTLGAMGAAVLSLLLLGMGWRRGAVRPSGGPRVLALLMALAAAALAGMPLVAGGRLPGGVIAGALLVLGLALFRAGEGVLIEMRPPARWVAYSSIQVAYVLTAIVLSIAAMASGFLGLLFYAALAAGGWVVLRRLLRRLPLPCPNGARPMRWLAEDQEPPFLQDAQRLEQELGSVDYDVWRCEECDDTLVTPHLRMSSPYNPCPRCGYRTLGTEYAPLASPTYFREGQARVTQRCRNCGFTRSYTRRLPRRVASPTVIGGWGGGWGRSSGGGWGGGGGGFGGGRAGGGGAGRGW